MAARETTARFQALDQKIARPVRVLHITDLETENYYLLNLFNHSDPQQVEYVTATFGPGGKFQASLRRQGYEAYAIECRDRRRYPQAARRLREIMRREEIDVVHTHLFEPTFVGVNIAKACGKRVIVTRHHSDAVHRIPNSLKRSVYLLAEKWINHCADHIIAPSRTVRDVLLKRENVPPAKVSLIPYGQTTERFDAVTPERIERVKAELCMSGCLALVCVARLSAEKGHRYLFEAFSELTRQGLDARLYLVGQGPDRQKLEDLARQFDIANRIRLLGWRDDALAIMAAADIVVHPSLQEALPSAVIEALMLERPLVVTDVSGVRDIVGESEHGLIVPPANAEALRCGLSQTIEDLPAARQRAQRGRQFVLEYMDAGRVADKHIACYRQVMARPLAIQQNRPLRSYSQ